MPDKPTYKELETKAGELGRALAEQKNINRQLQIEKAQFKLFFEKAPLSYQPLDGNGDFLGVNRGSLNVIGYSRDEFINRSFADFLHLDVETHLKENFSCLKAEELQAPPKGRVDTTVCKNGQLGVPLLHTETVAHATQVLQSESEALLALAQQFAHVGSWVLDVGSGNLTWSDETYRIFGLVPQELTATYQAFLDAVHPEDRKMVNAAYSSSLENRRDGYEIEHRIIHRQTGRIRHVYEKCIHERDDNGEIFRSMGMVQDITERKSNEQALGRHLEHLGAVVEILQYPADNIKDFLDHTLDKAIELTQSKIGFIYFYDEDRQEFSLNSWSKEVMKGCTINNPQTCYKLGVTGIWGEVVRKRQPLLINDYEAVNKPKNGYPQGHIQLTRFLSIPVMHKGRIVATVGVANKPGDYEETDVLELTLLLDAVWKSVEYMRSEEALRESEERFRRILNDIPMISVLGCQADGTILYWNEGSRILYGYDAEEVSGRNILEILVPLENRDSAVQKLQRMAETGVPEPPVETTRLRKDGSFVQVYSAHCILQKTGGPQELYSVNIDLSDIKRTEEERRKLTEQLTQAQKMESVGRLAGGVAHDFNNMLGVILGYAEMSLKQIDENSPVQSALEKIHNAAQRSTDLTRQLLAFARKQTVSPKVLDLNTTLHGMLTMLRRLIGEDIQLAWQPAEHLNMVKMDPSQIDQILVNLCVNAGDAIEDTGKITIETSNVTIDETYRSGHAEFIPGDYVLLAVSDNGSGIAREDLPRLFEPFFTTKKMGKGTGLGLATVYGIVKQNSGFIYVYSEPDEGTTFRIYLPCYAGEDGQVAQVVSGNEEPEEVGHETVLLVEDEPMILEMTTKVLARLGYHVLPAATPDEAIALAEQFTGQIRLLISDVIMPQMNGRDLAHELVSLYPDLKLLFMSGYTANIIEHHGVLDEGVSFIQKPFTREDLATKIRRILDQDCS